MDPQQALPTPFLAPSNTTTQKLINMTDNPKELTPLEVFS